MDRKSSKKIVKCVAIWLLSVIILTLGMWLFTGYVIQIKNRQLTELITIYPEMRIELTENFQFYQQQLTQKIRYLWLFLIIFSGIFYGILYYIMNRDSKSEYQCTLSRIDAINEQLKQFLKGNFQRTHFLMEKGHKLWEEEHESSEEGRKLWEEEHESLVEGHKLWEEEHEFSEEGHGQWEEEHESWEEEEEWFRIRESLLELGNYFSSLKEQLIKEENNTKALITDISHQLKTPLASLRMCYELIRAEKLTDSERKEFEEKEEQEIRKLEVLLEELVNLSRLEHHMIQIKPEIKSFKKTLLDAINQVYMKAHGKKIELEVKMKEDILIRHDSKWTVEALANVLDNAIKYSEPESYIEVRVTRLTNNLLIEIEDEGIGIQEEELHLIFKRFYRGKEAAKLIKDGAGVGLYLTRSILEQQGGTIIGKRKSEHGTIFKITLPLEYRT